MRREFGPTICELSYILRSIPSFCNSRYNCGYTQLPTPRVGHRIVGSCDNSFPPICCDYQKLRVSYHDFSLGESPSVGWYFTPVLMFTVFVPLRKAVTLNLTTIGSDTNSRSSKLPKHRRHRRCPRHHYSSITRAYSITCFTKQYIGINGLLHKLNSTDSR